MGRLVITDKPKPRLEIVEPRTRRRITPEEIKKGLGAEPVARVPPGGSPMSAYALRQDLFRRLRSTGGRPGLDGTDMKPKVPMRQSRWRKLEKLARQVEDVGFHPTPAQLASVILDAGIEQFDRALRLDGAEKERLKHEVENRAARTAPLTVRRLVVPLSFFRTIPPEKQSALTLLGMFLNDANWLRKLLVQAVLGISETPDGEANFTLTALLATLLAGKLHEGWTRMGENDLRAVLDGLPMPDALRTLRAEIERRLSSKLFKRIRNNLAFHYPNRKLDFAKLTAHLDDADLHIYVTMDGYNGDVLSHISTLAGLEPLLAIDPDSDYRVALRRVWDEVTHVTGLYCIFVAQAQASLLLSVRPPDGLPTDDVTIPDAPEAAHHPLRFFVRPPAELEQKRDAERDERSVEPIKAR